MKTILILLFLCLVGVRSEQTKQKTNEIIKISLGEQKTYKVSSTQGLMKHFQLEINESDLPKDQDRWYVFAMAERKSQNPNAIGSIQKIEIMVMPKDTTKNGRMQRQCKIQQQSDACMIKNNDFDYKTETLKFAVHCYDTCEFGFIVQIDSAYPLKLNKPFKLNFEDSAYSKIFSVNTEGNDFYQLRILLKPRGSIKYGQPIVLLANYGNQVPSRQQHDFKGLHIWDDGQGIIIRKSEMKERALTILVEGPEQNVLNLVVQTYSREQRIQLMEFWPQFDMLRASEYREYRAAISQESTYRFKVLSFTGEIYEVKLFKLTGNQQKSEALQFVNPNQKYGEFEYRVSKDLITKQNIKVIVIRVFVNKQTSFLVSFGRDDSPVTTILPYISQSSLMQPSQIDQYYIKIEQLIEQAKQKKLSNVEILVGNIDGDVDTHFYRCTALIVEGVTHPQNCEWSYAKRKQFTEMIPSKRQSRGDQKRYWFEIDWNDYYNSKDKDKTQIVFQMIVVVQNVELTNKKSSYEIQYKNKDRIYLLKQGETVLDRVAIQQKRHYKLSFQDSDATQIRIHCTQISGQTLFSGSVTDPRIDHKHQKILPVHNIISIKLNQISKVNQIFLQTEGVQNSYYSLTTQIIRKSESDSSKKSGKGYNELIVKQDIGYQFVISPSDSIVLQIHAKTKQFIINMKSTLAVQVCMTQKLDSPPYPPNCQIRKDSFLQMNQKVLMDKGLIGNIGIKNNNQYNVTIKIIISSTKQTCEMATMNQVMFKRVDENGKGGAGESVHCIQFQLNRIAEVQLIVGLGNNYQYHQGTISAAIGSEQKITMLAPSVVFSKQQVEKACKKDKKQNAKTCYLTVKISDVKQVKLRVLAQYTDEAIRLLDGVLHDTHGLMKKAEPRLFYFGIHNIQNITVFLQNKLGEYKIYGSIISYEKFTNGRKNNSLVYPTKKQKDLQSSNPFYYTEQLLTISKEKIKQKCQIGAEDGDRKGYDRWLGCVVLLSVVYDGQEEVFKNGKFVIEATQFNREIVQGTPLNGFLQQKAVTFYHYQNQVQNGTIVINVNNQNKNCLDLFMRKGSERATQSYYDKSAKASNTLIYSKAEKGPFAITVEANENCPYTITISSNANSIVRIKKGVFTDLNLKADQQSNLIFENLVNETFKVISMHKSGQVMISVNPVPKKQLQNILKEDISKTKNWKWSNKDSVRVNNVKTDKNGQQIAVADYCVDCYYLINVKALRQTEASIIIPTPDSEIPITADSLIKDLLFKNQKSIYRVFTQTKSQFEIYVQYGSVQISILEQQKVILNKTFNASDKPILQSFNLTKNQAYEYLRYAKVVIEAKQDTYFSFAIVTNSDPEKRGTQLKYGIPEYLYLQANKQKCINGVLSGSDQFLLSFSKSEKKVIENVKIQVKVNKTSVKLQKQLGINQMIITIPPVSDRSLQNFDFCLNSQSGISLTVIQASPVNYWPQKNSIVFLKEMNLTFGSQGKNIIQINQCKSRASIQIFSEFNNMKSSSSQIKQRRKSNNIIQFYNYGAVYIKAKAQKASLKWFTSDEASGTGQGYDDYQVGWMRIQKKQQYLQVNAQQIKKVQQKVKSKIQSVRYTIYAAREQMQLYNAMNCQDGLYASKSVTYNEGTNGDTLLNAKFNIKQQLLQKFKNLNYFLVGLKAQATIKAQNGQVQSYRFYYPYQQVSRSTITSSQKPSQSSSQQNKNQSEWVANFGTALGYILLLILVVVVIYLVYVKVIRRCFSKKIRLNQDMGMEMKYSDFGSSTN